jgi:hypothetical protein
MLTGRQNAAPEVSLLLFGTFSQHIPAIDQRTASEHPDLLWPSGLDEINHSKSVQFRKKRFNRTERIPPQDKHFGSPKLYPECRFYSAIMGSGDGLKCGGVKKQIVVCGLVHRRFTARTVLLRLILC